MTMIILLTPTHIRLVQALVIITMQQMIFPQLQVFKFFLIVMEAVIILVSIILVLLVNIQSMEIKPSHATIHKISLI